MARPDLSLIADYYHRYINQVTEDNLMEAFQKDTPALISLLEQIPPDKQDHRYEKGKWTIKEVLQHIIDAERIFDYRALRFSRKDPTPLPGFDENVFADNAKVDKRNWADLLEEFKAVRKGTELLFGSFDEEQLNAAGIASDAPNYVLGIGYIAVGHSIHHRKILQERYLS